MNPKLSEQMTLLGLGTLVFYGVMLGAGYLTTDVMPQFIVSAVIFLSSGRLMRKAARALSKEEEPQRPERKEPDWPWLTALLNWTAAFLVLGIMALFLMKPVSLTFKEAFSRPHTPEHYFATGVP